MKTFKRYVAMGLSGVLLLSALTEPSCAQAAKAKKVKLSKTKLTMQVGKKVTLKLVGYTKKKKVVWTANKKLVKLTPKGKLKDKVQVLAKKKGKVKVTAKAGQKKYTCVITVQKKKAAKTSQVPVPPAAEATTSAAVSVSEVPQDVPATSGGITSEDITETEAPPSPEPTINVTEPNKSHALLVGASSSSKDVQGVSVYSKGNVHLVEVFGDFKDIQDVYDSISYEYADQDHTSMVSENYSPEAYFSDGTPGYYTLELEGKLEGVETSQTYFVGRAGQFRYAEERDGTLVIKDFEGWGEHLVIPDTLDGKAVSAFGRESFYHKTLRDIVLPSGTVEMRKRAFHNALVEYIEFPEKLERIETETFLNCKNLDRVQLPSQIQSIGKNAFQKTAWYGSLSPDENGLIISAGILLNGQSAAGEVEIPSDVHCIADAAFLENGTMTKVTVPDSISVLPYQGFMRCASLAAVSLPEDLQSFEGKVFWNTPWQNNIASASGIAVVNHVLLDASEVSERVTLPSDVIKIAPYAFHSSIAEEVNGLENIKEIGDYAFSYSSVETLTLPEGLTVLGKRAFAESALTELVIPESIQEIENGLFYNCERLARVTLPDRIASIGNNAFYRCRRLEEIVIPASVKSVGSSAFYRCDELGRVTFQGKDTAIADDAFSRCYKENLTFYVPEGSLAQEYVKTKTSYQSEVLDI